MPLEIPAPSDRDTIDMPAAGARMSRLGGSGPGRLPTPR